MRARLESGSRGSRAGEGVDCLKAADQSPCEAKKACLRMVVASQGIPDTVGSDSLS